MLTKTFKIHSLNFSPVRIALFLLILFLLFVVSVKSQTVKNQPPWHGYRSITLGMTDAELRERLGAPNKEDEAGYFYIFSETENAQFLLDANRRVRTISVVFEPESLNAPTFEQVFGETAAFEPREDGSCFKRMRYEEAGYWISYSRLAGPKAMVIVLIQKL